MQVIVVGNSCSWFKRPNTNFIINDEILLDVPAASIKAMNGLIDIEKLKIVLITHFHSDHFADVHYIYHYIKHRKNKEKVTMIGPKSFAKKMKQLLRIFEEKISKKELLKYFNFIEVGGGEAIKIGNYQFQTFSVCHQVPVCLGYIVKEKANSTAVGFSGDTAMCDNLLRLIENCQTIFIDTATSEKNAKHLSTKEVLLLQQNYQDKTFYAIHTTDDILEQYAKRLHMPACGETIDIN